MRYLSGRVALMISVVGLAGGLTPVAWAETATPRPAAYPGASYGLDPTGALITGSGHSVPQAAAYPGASYGLDDAGHAIHESSSPSVVAATAS